MPGSCDPLSGECLICLSNTEGERCEKCQIGYYGTAVNGDCRSKHYHDDSVHDFDFLAKAYRLIDEHASKKMNECMFYTKSKKVDKQNVIAQNKNKTREKKSAKRKHDMVNCVLCFCGRPKNMCLKHVTTFSSVCDCDSHGSTSDDCDQTSGQCQCKEHYVGRQCDRCEVI